MTLHMHTLKGCSSAPLANYLKALGILRLVGEQADQQARGWWQGEHFCLLTKLSRQELETFFLESYKPTPLLSPWNAGSGFYRTWDVKKKKLRNSKNAEALDELLERGGARIQPLRSAVEEVRQVLPKFCKQVDVTKIGKKELGKLLIIPNGDGPVFPVIAKDDSGKALVQKMLLRFSRFSPFYQSALVEVEDEIKYPWIWGSGGNDGGIDYTGRFFENLCLVMTPKDQQVNSRLIQCALFGEQSNGFLSKASGKVGQFFPSAAGGANITTGTGSQHDTYLNPWDFVLLMEGAVVFSSRTTRRLDPRAMSSASAPFAVQSHAAGFATPGSEDAQRGEQWMPIWGQPATLNEVVAMVGEGRVQINRKPANRPVDVARAIHRLGMANGIESFIRFGYLTRNGDSRFAVPLGRINVPKQQNPRAYLIDDLAAWMDRVQRRCRDKNAPARLIHAERRLADSVFAALTHDPTPARWQAILLSAVDIEALQATGTAIEAQPIPSLKPEWVSAVNDGSAEVRLALALGSAAAFYFKGTPRDPVRHHCLPLEEENSRRFKTSDKHLVKEPRVVVSGRDPIRDLAAIVERRLIESAMRGDRRSRLQAAPGCGARLYDIARFLSGAVDLDKLLGLARAFMAIKWDGWKQELYPKRHKPDGMTDEAWKVHLHEEPGECWLAIRLACLPWQLAGDKDIPADPRLVRLLVSGDAGRAIEIARRRLSSVGIRPPIQAGVADSLTARRWAAALAFPVSHGTALKCLYRLDPRLKPKKGLLYA